MTRRADAAAGGSGFITETILKNIRVLAIDQTIQEDEEGKQDQGRPDRDAGTDAAAGGNHHRRPADGRSADVGAAVGQRHPGKESGRGRLSCFRQWAARNSAPDQVGRSFRSGGKEMRLEFASDCRSHWLRQSACSCVARSACYMACRSAGECAPSRNTAQVVGFDRHPARQARAQQIGGHRPAERCL